MKTLRLTEYTRAHIDAPGSRWDKIADYYIDDDGLPSIEVDPEAREKHPNLVARAELNFKKRVGIYSHSLNRNVEFEDGDEFLRAKSEFKGSYTSWELHNVDGNED